MTRLPITVGVCVLIAVAVSAQAPEPPIADIRLTVHTLVREDVFAGFLQNDLVRLARAEKNIDQMLASRPADRASLLAWQGGTALTRAVLASEGQQQEQFQQHYRRSQALFADAMRLGPAAVGVFAVVGGSQVVLADRLPAAERAAGWEQAYTAYQRLWTLQSAVIEKLPVHHRGELLAGLAQSAQRTGRTGEITTQLDRMLTLLPNTPYAKRAQQWKDDPATRVQAKLTCQTCHATGMLSARLVEVATAQRPSSPEARLQALGIQLPAVSPPIASYVPAVRTGNLIYLAGQGPITGGKPTVTGKVGAELTEEQGNRVARETILNSLAVLRAEIGSLDRVRRIVKLVGWVNSAPGFTRQPWVINGASDLLVEIFGDAGKHARSAVGANELPLNIPVEIELIVEVAPDTPVR
jgi:enamine deaminase RidA (YjgF/YER057c/UK114 family)